MRVEISHNADYQISAGAGTRVLARLDETGFAGVPAVADLIAAIRQRHQSDI